MLWHIMKHKQIDAHGLTSREAAIAIKGLPSQLAKKVRGGYLGRSISHSHSRPSEVIAITSTERPPAGDGGFVTGSGSPFRGRPGGVHKNVMLLQLRH